MNTTTSPFESLGAFAVCFFVGVVTCYAGIKAAEYISKAAREKAESEFKAKAA